MNRLSIAALALGAFGFAQSAVASAQFFPARLTQADHGLMQKADDRDQGLSNQGLSDQGLGGERGDYWGRGGGGDRMWRDTRPWSDDQWRNDPDLDQNAPDDDD
ncbi:hypothetical protein IYY11_09405 [Methylocystis sp. H62]|uniref:hypothetical protein n=1 Tax=Methylocystis sp. H62 TaxID=2785789 RepID=UPI0018C2446D|nr:hypothetical protein [Methylocystis sp. H62]MBG0793592.1 hypothetical protein [Methylocystis sp. H62]